MIVPFPLLRQRLRQCRAAARLTQHQLAERSGISAAYIADIELHDDANPTLLAVWHLARALGVGPAYLLGVDALTVLPRATGMGHGQAPQQPRDHAPDGLAAAGSGSSFHEQPHSPGGA